MTDEHREALPTLTPFLHRDGRTSVRLAMPVEIGSAVLDADISVDRFDGRCALGLSSRDARPFVAQGCRYRVDAGIDLPAFLQGRIEGDPSFVTLAAEPGQVDLAGSFPVERPYDAETRAKRRLAKAFLGTASRTAVHPYLTHEAAEAFFAMTVRQLAEILGAMRPVPGDARFSAETLRSVAASRAAQANRVHEAFVGAVPAYRHGLGFAFLRPDGRLTRFAVDPAGGRPLGHASGVLFPTLDGLDAAARRAGMTLPGPCRDIRESENADGTAILAISTVEGLVLVSGGWDALEVRPFPKDGHVHVGEAVAAA